MNKEQKYSNKTLLKRFIPYFKGYYHYLVFDLFCAGLTTVCELALPVIVKEITDAGLADLSSLTTKRIVLVVVFYLFLRIIDAGANYYMNSGGHAMGALMETDMRNDLFAHLQRLSYSFYDNAKVGQLMSRITTDLFDISEFAHHMPEEIFIAALKVIVGFFIFASMDLRLALIVFVALPLMFFSTQYSRSKMRDAFSQSRHQLGEINSQTEDSLLGIRVVKSFANEEIEKSKFDEGTGIFLRIKKKSYSYMANFHTTVRLFDGIMYILVVAVGAVFMRNGQISFGDFSASLLMISTLLGSIRRIVDFSEQYNRGLTGIQRFLEVIDENIDIEDSVNAKEISGAEGKIEFRGVSFIYPETEKYVLKNLNLSIEKGENIAIVGPSGGGKTTLCNLIPRFYDVSEGEVLLDGINIKDITMKSLRSNIGVVQQDVYLFSGTVFENIEYGKPGATLEEVIEAAKKAGADEFINEMPDKYSTYVGERGVKLSGGQKQRISIARVFLKNPPVILLDEATSALDNESEKIVQHSLDLLAKGRTTLTIAHRLTTIKNAKRILVLTDDGIAEQGSHDELIAKKGMYYELYSLYATI